MSPTEALPSTRWRFCYLAEEIHDSLNSTDLEDRPHPNIVSDDASEDQGWHPDGHGLDSRVLVPGSCTTESVRLPSIFGWREFHEDVSA